LRDYDASGVLDFEGGALGDDAERADNGARLDVYGIVPIAQLLEVRVER
jgi:hypothetical protein